MSEVNQATKNLYSFFLQNGTQIEQLYEQYINASSLDVSWISFYQQCYDAAWAMARALHKTYTGMLHVMCSSIVFP